MLQNVVSKANRENTPARIIAQVPMLSPNCMYASSFSSAPLVPRRTVPVTIRTNTEESPKPMKIYLDGYICKEPVYRKTPFVKSDGIYVIIYVMKPFRAQSYVSMACWKPVSALSLAAAASM